MVKSKESDSKELINTKSIAFFDFDGTITNKDAFLKFLSFAVNPLSLFFGIAILSPVILAYYFKIIPNSRAKEILFSWFFSGMLEGKLEEKCEAFNATIIPTILKELAMTKLNWHSDNNHEVVIVTANFDLLLKRWCTQHGLKLISTGIEIKDKKITGKFSTSNCYGEEKVRRIKKLYNLNDYLVYAYGDSQGDIPMLELAQHRFYRAF